MRHTLLLFFIFSLAHLPSSAQTLKLTEQPGGSPIPDAFVYHEDKIHFSYTDQKGMADVSAFPTGKINIQHPSYYEGEIDYAGQDMELTLKEKILSYNEVIVSANKWEQEEQTVSQQIMALSKKEIQFQNPQTSADLLANSGQVFVQKSQYGGGSPKIRGFAANSVLLVVDGVRMNNAIFRSGNLQNVINIDPNALESTEVIFGPGSVIYGSDALGGVMDFHTLTPKWSSDEKTDFSLNAFTRYSTAASEKTGHLDVSVSNPRWTFLHSSTFSSFGDLQAGARRRGGYKGEFERKWTAQRIDGQDQLVENENINLQSPSGYNMYNSVSKFKLRLGKSSDLSYGFYLSTTSDIPRYDLLTQTLADTDSLSKAAWYYGPQEWVMHSLKWNFYRRNPLFDQSRVTLSYQNFKESRHDRSFGDDRLRTRSEQVDMATLSIDFDKELKKSALYYGVDYAYNDVTSSAFRKNIETGEVTEADSRYPSGGSQYAAFAIYVSNTRPLSKKVTMNSGLRFNVVHLKAKTTDERALSTAMEGIDIQNEAINGSFGLTYAAHKAHKLSYHFSTGFRAPNVDDVGKLFDVGTQIDIPNADLEPEYTLSNEISYQYRTGDVLIQLTGFHSRLFNGITESVSTLNGSEVTVIEGDSLTVISKTNTESAFLYGGSLRYHHEIFDHWALSKTISYTGGRDAENNEPLRHTTPIFGRAAITFQQNKFRGEAFAEYQTRRTPDQIPTLEFEEKPYLYTQVGTPAWCTLNLRASYRITDKILLIVAVENLLDQHYRPYTSGISAPGRNFIFSLKSGI